MSTDWPTIWASMWDRRKSESVLMRQMIEVRDRVNGDVVIPLPDVEGEPNIDPPSPRLIADAIDSTAMRAASQPETIYTPALDPTKLTGMKSLEFAAIRRRALYASWHHSAVEVLKFRMYRHLVGYGTAALVVLPDYTACANESPKTYGRAKVELRDPLTSYPELRSPDDVREPKNVGFVFGRSAKWLRGTYPSPDLEKMLRGGADTLWDCVEWIDEDEIVMGILGPRFAHSDGWPIGGSDGMELRRWPNRAGMVPVACPRRVTLDRIMSQVATLVGPVDMLTRMKALAYVATEKAVFQDLVVIGQNGRVPTLVGGKWKDGRTGDANVVLDGTVIPISTSIGPATFQEMSSAERDIRMSSGNPGMFGGELTGSLRSGQTVSSLAGVSIDPRIQEAHGIAQRALTVVNEAILATEKGYWPNQKYFVFSGQEGQGMIEYTPSKHFETTENAVKYGFPGMDLSQVTVAVAQLSQAGISSRKTARKSHPLIVDAEAEERAVLVEQLDDAYLAGLLARFGTGEVPDIDYATLRAALVESADIGKAVEAAQRAAQERQAKLAPEPEEGQIAAPEAMPGMAMPGMGAEQPATQTQVEVNPADLFAAMRARAPA